MYSFPSNHPCFARPAIYTAWTSVRLGNSYGVSTPPFPLLYCTREKAILWIGFWDGWAYWWSSARNLPLRLLSMRSDIYGFFARVN